MLLIVKIVPEALKGLASLSIQDKKSKGQELNTIKKFIEESIKDQKIQNSIEIQISY